MKHYRLTNMIVLSNLKLNNKNPISKNSTPQHFMKNLPGLRLFRFQKIRHFRTGIILISRGKWHLNKYIY